MISAFKVKEIVIQQFHIQLYLHAGIQALRGNASALFQAVQSSFLISHLLAILPTKG